jgi:hypothetical protein
MSSIASCLHTGRSKPQNWCRSGSSDTSLWVGDRVVPLLLLCQRDAACRGGSSCDIGAGVRLGPTSRASSAHHRVGLSCASSARMRRRTSGSAAVVTPDALSEVCDPKPAFRGTAVRRSGVRISDGESVDRPSGPETGVRRAVRRAGEAWSGHLAPPSAPRSGRLRTGTWRRSLCCIRQELPRCP